MSKKIGVVVMTALLLLYIVTVAQLAWALFNSGDAIAIAMGVALAVLPLVAIWGIASELLFGVRSERLLTKLEHEGRVPDAVVPLTTSGRPERDAADEQFAQFAREVEEQPESWQAWLRLGLAYDASGDRRRARGAVRKAISLERVASIR